MYCESRLSYSCFPSPSGNRKSCSKMSPGTCVAVQKSRKRDNGGSAVYLFMYFFFLIFGYDVFIITGQRGETGNSGTCSKGPQVGAEPMATG